jgi:hypothetical protein
VSGASELLLLLLSRTAYLFFFYPSNSPGRYTGSLVSSYIAAAGVFVYVNDIS